MAAKVWNASVGAFQDAETPKVNSGGVWSDSVGKVWDSSSQAWKDAWSERELLLYDNGDEKTNVTGGYTAIPLPPGYSSEGYKLGTRTKEASSLYLYGRGYRTYGAFCTVNKIPFGKYSKICFYGECSTNSPASRNNCLVYFPNSPSEGNEGSVLLFGGTSLNLSTVTTPYSDVSDGYLVMRLIVGSEYNITAWFRIYKIWLEK